MLIQLHLDAVVLYALLLGHFIHHSHRSTTVAVARAAVLAVTVDPPLRCSSDSSITFNVIGVSSWFFPSGLFRHYRAPIAGVVSPSHRIRHGRCRAHFVPQSIQLRTSVGAYSRGEHVGAFAIVGDLAVIEISPVNDGVHHGQCRNTVSLTQVPPISLCGCLRVGTKGFLIFFVFQKILKVMILV